MDEEEMAKHRPMCYYMMNKGCIEEKNAFFERPDEGMKNHLKPLFIRGKVEDNGVNKILVDGGAAVNLMIQFMLERIGSVLAQEGENSTERAIYCLSRFLNDAKTRIEKWDLSLTEYSLTYMPLKAMKGQVVADFIVDHTMTETHQAFVEPEPWKLYFDGSSYKDGIGIGVLIISPNKIPTKFKYQTEGSCSNNEAEYEALIVGLKILLELGETRVEISGDYELVVKRINGEYKCVKENLIMYFMVANRLL
ncbi:uncharacterized protein LOC127121832 [Lathyrus oleraceus]|uniref:uncharacterized protein LOC127121832 n=1 Tax=Pisum sativum TaxID=3888 RepID=UPI0021D25AE5|nr:uncharacterized protein LOC127121832 [Pisum sativum]